MFNLSHYLEVLGAEVFVQRNDQITVAEIVKMSPQGIVLSPGPCKPEDAGICVELIQKVAAKIPILGVCLGHQAVGLALGGKVIRSHNPQHGSSSAVYHKGQGVFADLPNPFPAGRYHSLIVEENSLPKELKVTARTSDGMIMGLEHIEFPVFGVQFHPESILTEGGILIVKNFLELIKMGRNE